MRPLTAMLALVFCWLSCACSGGGDSSNVSGTVDRVVDLEQERAQEECRCSTDELECAPEALDLQWLECFKRVAEQYASEIAPELECRVRKLEAEIPCLARADCEDVDGWEACYELGEDCDDSFTESHEDEVERCARGEGPAPAAGPAADRMETDGGTPSSEAPRDGGAPTAADARDGGDRNGTDNGTDSGNTGPEPAPSGDAGGADGASPFDAGEVAQVTAGEVSFEVLTKATPLGRYAPRNVVAIWVDDDVGQPVRALAVWAAVRVSALETFSGLFPSLAALNQSTARPADVVSGATLADHQWRRVTWNLLDQDGQRVPDGGYVMRVEVADSLDGSSLGQVPFDVGPDALDIEVPETDEFGPMHLRYTTAAP